MTEIIWILDLMSIEKFQKISPKRLIPVRQSLCFAFGLYRVSCSSNSTISSLLKCKFSMDSFRNAINLSLVSMSYSWIFPKVVMQNEFQFILTLVWWISHVNVRDEKMNQIENFVMNLFSCWNRYSRWPRSTWGRFYWQYFENSGKWRGGLSH